MASGRQPEDDLPSFFGYEFPLPQNAPHPAGAPLLSDNERSALDDWLQIFMGNAGPMDNNLSLDPIHSENWNDMPPHFGYQTRPTNLAAQYHNSNLMMQNGGQQTLDPSHMSPTTLLQAASHMAGPQMAARHASIANPMGAGANAPLGLHLGGASSPTARAFPGADMGAGVASFNLAAAADGQAAHRPELQWGTDQSFRHKQFIPRSIKETSDAILHQKLEVMECLEVNPSAATTRQATPTFEPEPTSNGSNAVPFILKTRTTSFISNDGRAPVVETPDEMAPPRKKRKSKSAASSKGLPVAGDIDNDEDAIDGNGGYANGNGDDDDEDTANGALAKNGKPRKRKTKAAVAQSLKSSASPPNLESIPERSVSQDGNDSSGAQASGTPTSASATKRRRSAQVKPPRENLSEEQKRENHIKSEQKRRTLIKTGFEDLGILVPGLDGGSHSKSTMLMIAANYLEELLKGNKQLREEAGL
ncbi:bhlh family transcription factor [Ophiostoma piceae UAMH 11346]|uniref:Bhlh family transcription factor n=1 Tax=Ophiostoma piceae (strain UAMH 11346) TaxID=1262450 RepID=S3C792_OPHP1|nr:bhlh family transcription factor [Ophiostoma piceae UAMH 11346]